MEKDQYQILRDTLTSSPWWHDPVTRRLHLQEMGVDVGSFSDHMPPNTIAKLAIEQLVHRGNLAIKEAFEKYIEIDKAGPDGLVELRKFLQELDLPLSTRPPKPPVDKSWVPLRIILIIVGLFIVITLIVIIVSHPSLLRTNTSITLVGTVTPTIVTVLPTSAPLPTATTVSRSTAPPVSPLPSTLVALLIPPPKTWPFVTWKTTIDDPMSANSSPQYWRTSASNGDSCAYVSNGYESVNIGGYLQCTSTFAYAQVAFEVQYIQTAGVAPAGAWVIIGANDQAAGYSVKVGANGNGYELRQRIPGQNDKIINSGNISLNPPGQVNTVGIYSYQNIVAWYLNHQLIAYGSTYPSVLGPAELVALPAHTGGTATATVIFSNAKIYNLG